ncbi:MAG: ABC transporter substrate-binding protein [Acidimicrobiia bacterium]|nr:ABC transporter substrate-binding protein [Acidimicrobiia bacterium]
MKRIVGVVLMTALLAGCGSSDSVPTEAPEATTARTTLLEAGSFTGVDGVTSDVSDSSRVVALTGDITEVIFELGLGDRVVAVDITTTHPPETDDIKSGGGLVGFGQALNVEAVLKFEPTLVIGDETIEPQETIDLIRGAGVPVVIMEYHTTLEGVGQKIRDVAHIMGVPERGEELAEEVGSRIDEARERATWDGDAPRVAYLYTRGPSLIFLFGEGIPTNAMIEGAGAIDVGAEVGEGSMALTPEALVSAAPDVIVVPESGLVETRGMEALLEIPGVSETPAGRSEAFLAYDEAYFFNLGPRAGDALADFVADLRDLMDG